MKGICLMCVVGLCSALPSLAVTCLTPSNGSFETYTVWFNEFNNEDNSGVIVGPNGEISGTGGGSSPEQPTPGGVGPTPGGVGPTHGPNGEVPGGETPGGPSSGGDGGSVVGPNGEVPGGETPGGPSSGGDGGSVVGPNGEVPSPSPGDGVIVGPNGELSGGGDSGPIPSPGGSPSGGGSTPTDLSTGGNFPPTGSPVSGTGGESPLDPYKNTIERSGRDGVVGPVAGIRPLKNVVNGVSDANFNRSFEAPSFIAVAATRAPGDAKPAPAGQRVVYHNGFDDNTAAASEGI